MENKDESSSSGRNKSWGGGGRERCDDGNNDDDGSGNDGDLNLPAVGKRQRAKHKRLPPRPTKKAKNKEEAATSRPSTPCSTSCARSLDSE